jgi:8-oxo-dGTP pyrophosphatase MutT (NUDIX family)
MSLPIRNSIKVLLLNDNNELLLMSVDDPKTTTVEGKYNGRFWDLIGGEIEPGESVQEAAIREVFEETGIAKEQIELGPIVWFGEFDLVLAGKPTHLKQKFMVAKTKQKDVSLCNLTEPEQAVVEKLAWFSLEQIINSDEIIYPVVLPDYLPDIISGNYPDQPFEIDLAKVPKKRRV